MTLDQGEVDGSGGAFERPCVEGAVRCWHVDPGDLQWLDTILSILESRIATGQASTLELLKAQNEKSKRAERQTTDLNQGFHERTAMNIMLGRPLEVPWPDRCCMDNN